MKIGIITAGVLPVPPIKGGAVENLVYSIINENEKADNPIKIDLYGIGIDEVNFPMTTHKNTTYKFMNENIKHKIMDKICITKILKKISDQYNYYPYLSQVLEKISQNEYDYIIIENRPQFVLPIKKITKSKIILHIHNDYLCGDSKDDISIINACYKILVVSDYMKQKMIKNLKYYEDKIIVLYNGIDSNRFNKKLSEKQRIKIREDYGIKKDDFVIIFTGRLIEQKGILQLLRAVKKIQSVENIKVLIVGSSWYSSDSITEYVARLHDESKSIKDKIIFTGYIDYNKLNKLYDVADIAVLPSMWEEPLGMVILEAMSMQLPVISTNSGGIVEVITDKENGFLFDRDSKLEDNIAITIQKLYKYKSLCNLIGNNARDLIENKFNTKIYYNNFIKILK